MVCISTHTVALARGLEIVALLSDVFVMLPLRVFPRGSSVQFVNELASDASFSAMNGKLAKMRKQK